MGEIVYLNGAFLPRQEAKIPVMDYGFLFGYGLFETMRAYAGRVFRLDSHLARLAVSAATLGIPVDTSILKNAIVDTVAKNGLKEARVRTTVSAGEGGPVPDTRTCTCPTTLVVATRYAPYPRKIYERGFRVIISSTRRNSRSPVPAMKTTGYLENLLSRQEARVAAADDALLLNDRGKLAEASTSNVFLVKGNTLKTPRTENGILPGITRDVILELALQIGITTLEADILPDELLSANEAFLTSSLMEVMPLTGISGKAIGSGKPGAVTGKLAAAYKDLVLKETTTA